MKEKSENIIVNTSPNPSKGGEKTTLAFVRNVIVRKQLPLFWRGLGGGAARNDVKRTPRRAMPHANDLWAFSPKNKAESLTSTAWGIALRNEIWASPYERKKNLEIKKKLKWLKSDIKSEKIKSNLLIKSIK